MFSFHCELPIDVKLIKLQDLITALFDIHILIRKTECWGLLKTLQSLCHPNSIYTFHSYPKIHWSIILAHFYFLFTVMKWTHSEQCIRVCIWYMFWLFRLKGDATTSFLLPNNHEWHINRGCPLITNVIKLYRVHKGKLASYLNKVEKHLTHPLNPSTGVEIIIAISTN